MSTADKSDAGKFADEYWFHGCKIKNPFCNLQNGFLKLYRIKAYASAGATPSAAGASGADSSATGAASSTGGGVFLIRIASAFASFFFFSSTKRSSTDFLALLERFTFFSSILFIFPSSQAANFASAAS